MKTFIGLSFWYRQVVDVKVNLKMFFLTLVLLPNNRYREVCFYFDRPTLSFNLLQVECPGTLCMSDVTQDLSSYIQVLSIERTSSIRWEIKGFG